MSPALYLTFEEEWTSSFGEVELQAHTYQVGSGLPGTEMSPRGRLAEEIDRVLSKRERIVIGLMSGTSGDGITAAVTRIEGNYTETKLSVVSCETYPYEKHFRQRIFETFDPETSGVDIICEMNFEIGQKLAEAAIAIAGKAGMPMSDVDIIGSHGQTIYHIPRPPEKGNVRSTLQIGEPAVIAERTGVLTVADFRKMDVAAGGEGAPLVPYVDYILFGKRGKSMTLQNIGGIGNVTYIPPGAKEDDVIAFDTGPGNMVMDMLAQLYTDSRLTHDPDGSMALKGKVNDRMVDELMNMQFFRMRPPKSTGRELFGRDFVLSFKRKADDMGMKPEDAIATATALTVESIARSYENFVMPHGKVEEVFIAGGGMKNRTMMSWLSKRLGGVPIRSFEELGIQSEAREAAYFAVLANEFIHGNYSNLPAATGAKTRAILGSMCYAGSAREPSPQ
jgi:anhydro-N-acetylmuramic acid kinase